MLATAPSSMKATELPTVMPRLLLITFVLSVAGRTPGPPQMGCESIGRRERTSRLQTVLPALAFFELAQERKEHGGAMLCSKSSF